ncbi:MAG: DUF438 domain-containing protein [Bacteriovoracaceae bacterium]
MKNRYPEEIISLPHDHPVKVYFDENDFLQNILEELKCSDPKSDLQRFFNLFNQLCEVEKRFARKENQLFPYLEKYGWYGPSQGMWAFHDSIRDQIRSLRKKIESKESNNLALDIKNLSDELQRLMMIEETRLLPYALQLLKEEDWNEMRKGEVEIGWMHQQNSSSEVLLGNTGPMDEKTFNSSSPLQMNEGFMNLEQINLMLEVMPIDLTYVDENDKVIFYNRGEDRVFPRSAGIIGREVRFCHPPKSVSTVLRIVNEFKAGTKDTAEFWIRYRGKVVHIRYFAIRDHLKKYRGVIELSQDITEIQKLEGERRLLNWDLEEERS